MEKEKVGHLKSELEQKMFQSYKSFMTRVTLSDESVTAGSQLLTGFQQGLEFLRRPPVNSKSELVKGIIKANETKRVISYFESGCIHPHDAVLNMNKLRICLLGLQNYIGKAKTMLEELECQLSDVGDLIQTEKERNNNADVRLQDQATSSDEGESTSSDLQLPRLTDYAMWMAIIYSMLKQDLEMQERIVSALGLKVSSGELESYVMMWSLRPFVNDELMHQAWRLIH